MKFAITPCPNDTFSYYALANGLIKNGFEFVFDDIEALNLTAETGKYPVTKMSFAAFLKNRERYELLDAGAALGLGTGPILVAREGTQFDHSKPVAVPGLNTTGAQLLKYYAGCNLTLVPMHFREIADAVKSGAVDAGVLIHEGRFVFSSMGLKLVADLGGYWTEKTQLPVPLGCICIRKDKADKKERVENLIRQSVLAAFEDPQATYPYVKKYAQYLDDAVLRQHIYAFVNEYSKDISSIREKLLENLEKC